MPSRRIALWVALVAVSAFALGAAVMTAARGVVGASNAASADSRYLADSEIAMKAMMTSMAGVSTGDVDRDFVAQMVPHHQGAIDMAEAFLRNGHDERLKRLAQEIVVTQRDEIAAMQLAMGKRSRSDARTGHSRP